LVLATTGFWRHIGDWVPVREPTGALMRMKVIVVNRKARHDYQIIETIEAGIALLGNEVKSLREGRANLRDSYAVVEDGEVILRGLHIGPYSHATYDRPDPLRDRKLLLNKSEIKRLLGKTREKGLTLIALKMYFNQRGRAKVELALVKGKRQYDKRQDIAERDARREVERAMKHRR
jgi:SsrA-binding protein